jgi:hypothetical protein
MPRLFAAATDYISLSCGEGWDQAMAEAAATGLNLIAPDHSGYQGYLDDEVAHLIPSREVPATFPGGDWVGRLFDGVHWWQPDVRHAEALIRAAIDGTAPPKQSAHERMAERFRWDQATVRLAEILGEAAELAGRAGH